MSLHVLLLGRVKGRFTSTLLEHRASSAFPCFWMPIWTDPLLDAAGKAPGAVISKRWVLHYLMIQQAP